MNYLKVLLVAISVFILFFAVKPAAAETISASPYSVNYAVSANNHVEYVYINDRLYEVTYSDDGRILMVDPVE